MVVEKLPIGTNLALYQFLWMLVSGALHDSRGALFPALQATGLNEAEVRRAWAAFRYGAWSIEGLLHNWHRHVVGQAQWQAYSYAGYCVKAVDITAYWRPTLQGIKSQHYDPQADKALPAVVFGLVGRVGRVGEQRLALLTNLLRADLTDPSEMTLQTKLLKQVAQELAGDEMPVFDAGFKLKALAEAGLPRFVVRLAKNFTARRNFLPDYAGGRPAEYGVIVRPLPRAYTGQPIEATLPDRMETWSQHGLEFRAEFWDDLVLPECKPSADNPTFCVAAIYDPRFKEPWLLACPFQLGLTGGASIMTAGQLSKCPWPPNTWSALIVSLSSPKRVVTAYPSYPCWLALSSLISPPPCRLSRPASGIASPRLPPVAYAVGWPGRLSQT